MNLHEYKLQRERLISEAPKYRTICTICTQPDFACYCSQVQSFDAKINFVVLIHPIEVKRRIATGRMSHLCLKDSYLIKGQNYTQDNKVNDLIKDQNFHSVILYPGPTSKNLSRVFENEKQHLFSKNKKLRIFVIDGTWATAKKMLRQSENLKTLPRICFSPAKPSNFRVRKQPNANCYSTIEAIHQTIELIGESQGFNVKQREHDKLLHLFNHMVERQLDFVRESNLNLRTASYRSEGQKKIS
jgi:DTW domain-containing protein YfiP